MTRHGGLRNIQNGLEIRDEERRDGETVDDAEPSGLREYRQQVGNRRGGLHMRQNEYNGRACHASRPA